MLDESRLGLGEIFKVKMPDILGYELLEPAEKSLYFLYQVSQFLVLL